MPSQALTSTPTVLAGITADTNYTVQNRSSENMYIQVDANAPTDPSAAFVLPPAPAVNSGGVVKAPTGENIYVWNAGILGGGAVVYDEAP